MAKRIIEISVNDEYVVGSGVVIGAAGSDESVILRVAFNGTWAGLNIYATFRDSMGESPTIMMLMPSMLVLGETMKYDVVVPAAATKHAGKMCLVFSGFTITESYLYAKDGETVVKELVYRDAVINTTNAYFRVLPSDFSALDVEDQAEVTKLEQVLSEINGFHGELTEFEGRVNDAISEHEIEVAATIGDLGTYEDENGETVPYTVEGRLEVQDKIIDEFKNDCDNGKYTVGIDSIEKEIPAQYVKPDDPSYYVDTYKISLTDGKDFSFTVTNGMPFMVARIYNSINEMNAGFASDGVPTGAFVIINTGDVEDENNAKLYIKGAGGYVFATDLSGATGIQGPRGDSYIITPDDKAEIAQKIQDEYFGDINAALDAILAIQKDLIPPTIITFTIADVEYTAIEGMTWGEWVESEYNTAGARVYNTIIIEINGWIIGNESEWCQIYTDEAIIENGVYVNYLEAE